MDSISSRNAENDPHIFISNALLPAFPNRGLITISTGQEGLDGSFDAPRIECKAPPYSLHDFFFAGEIFLLFSLLHLLLVAPILHSILHAPFGISLASTIY